MSRGTRIGSARGPGRGFTIVELMVVLVIVALLALLAAPSLVEFKRNSELNAATNQLLSSVNAARTEAMRRGTRAGLVPFVADDWTRGWRVFVDADLDGQLSAGDPTILEQELPPGGPLQIGGSGTAADAGGKYLLFDGSGYARTRGGAFSPSTLSIRRRDTLQADASRMVKVARTGRVRSCRPGTSTDCDGSED